MSNADRAKYWKKLFLEGYSYEEIARMESDFIPANMIQTAIHHLTQAEIMPIIRAGEDHSEDPCMWFCRNVNMLRLLKGWSQMQLARESGIDCKIIRLLEKAVKEKRPYNITLHSAKDLAIALEKTIDELMEKDCIPKGDTQ